jgi:superoxide dismutase, Fe-Mn family
LHEPRGGGNSQGDVATRIDQAFGGFDKFQHQFAEAAQTQFGSGLAWLVLENGRFKVMKTSNAVNPLATHGISL